MWNKKVLKGTSEGSPQVPHGTLMVFLMEPSWFSMEPRMVPGTFRHIFPLKHPPAGGGGAAAVFLNCRHYRLLIADLPGNQS